MFDLLSPILLNLVMKEQKKLVLCFLFLLMSNAPFLIRTVSLSITLGTGIVSVSLF